jgi:hypothetical protein
MQTALRAVTVLDSRTRPQLVKAKGRVFLFVHSLDNRADQQAKRENQHEDFVRTQATENLSLVYSMFPWHSLPSGKNAAAALKTSAKVVYHIPILSLNKKPVHRKSGKAHLTMY